MEFGGQGKALVDELLANQRLSAEDQKRALGHISAATRMMVHESFELSNNSTLTGRLANRSQHLAHFTFKYSGGQFWQRAMQRAAHTSMSKHMADELQTKRWDQLNQPMQDMLLRSGITENDWITLQGLNDKLIAKEALDTNDLFLADSVRELSDDVVAVRILNDPEASGRAIRSARNELEQKAQNAIFTFVNDAVIKPDSRTTSALTGGQAAGTLEGFLFRGITNLMSWPYAFTMRALGNEFEQGGAGTAAKGLFKLQGLMMAYATFGLAAQDALVENTTRDWLSNDPSVQANNFADIASRSGVGGMYGGWLLGLARYGQSPFSLFGPGGDVVGRTLEDVYRSGMELSQGEVEESTARFGQAIENVAPDLPIFQPIFMSAAMNEANKIIDPSYEKIGEQAGREPLFDTN
jgi:hypothetical protein